MRLKLQEISPSDALDLLMILILLCYFWGFAIGRFKFMVSTQSFITLQNEWLMTLFEQKGANMRSVEEPVEIGRHKTSRLRYKMLGPAASLDELFALTHGDDNSIRDGRTLL
jgi:hypothetical protein